jgi:hypothetical protein
MSRYRTANADLPPPPTHEQVVKAMVALDEEERRQVGLTANSIAWKLGMEGARRMGRGAVKGSWTGYMSPALRLAPTLEAMSRKGLADWFYDPSEGSRGRKRYSLTAAGRRLTQGDEA